MYIKRSEANIAGRSQRQSSDPDVSLIEHKGEQVYVLTATLARKEASVGSIYQSSDGELWISLDSVTPEDIQRCRQATDEARADAEALTDMRKTFNVQW